jgi:energy-coupling factor transporter ATP-binding protein EcfA2
MSPESSSPLPSAKSPVSSFASLLLAPQLRWAYLLFLAFLLLVGLAFVAAGVFQFREFLYVGAGLPSSLVSLSVGLLLIIIFFFMFQARRYLTYVKDTAAKTIAEVALGKLRADDFEGFDEVARLREEKARWDFQRNLDAIIVVQQFEAKNAVLFNNIAWNLQPGVNVLLGRNGYGKSLLLRGLAGALQHDEKSTEALVRDAINFEEENIRIRVKRNADHAYIVRNARRFTDSVGKVPLLAIPDSRFFDRSQTSVGANDSDTVDLRVDGAYHFLNQLPYGSVIQGLIYEMCLDYWEHGRTFHLPVFEFMRQCVERLTDYDFSFVSIERQGRTGFEVRVRTEGNKEPLPIQYASQGTLSVIAMLGLIRTYVHSISGNTKEKAGVQDGSAIVLIDEADAHLHPAWQQKFPTLLRDFFPNVQFILSAHSPLFVAGCWNGEVAILRRQLPDQGTGFIIEQPSEDFVGASPSQLYQQIFEIEDRDDTYLQYATKATQTTLREQRNLEVEKLTKEQEQTGSSLAPAQEEHLANMVEEERRIRRASELTKAHRDQISKDVRIAQLEGRVLELETEQSQLQSRSLRTETQQPVETV